MQAIHCFTSGPPQTAAAVPDGRHPGERDGRGVGPLRLRGRGRRRRRSQLDDGHRQGRKRVQRPHHLRSREEAELHISSETLKADSVDNINIFLLLSLLI